MNMLHKYKGDGEFSYRLFNRYSAEGISHATFLPNYDRTDQLELIKKPEYVYDLYNDRHSQTGLV